MKRKAVFRYTVKQQQPVPQAVMNKIIDYVAGMPGCTIRDLVNIGCIAGVRLKMGVREEGGGDAR